MSRDEPLKLDARSELYNLRENFGSRAVTAGKEASRLEQQARELRAQERAFEHAAQGVSDALKAYAEMVPDDEPAQRDDYDARAHANRIP